MRAYGDICIHIADSLCCTAEINTTLYSNYTPIKILKNFKKRIKTIISGLKEAGRKFYWRGMGSGRGHFR